MRVAIIGAGLAGLSCAHELERYGIRTVIYEKNSFIGEPYPHITAVVNISHRPIKDSVQYFKKRLNIEVAPLNTIDRLIHHSPNSVSTIEGDLGYVFNYTKDKNSLKYQIYSRLKKTKILFNEFADYKILSVKYDYVVVAT
ncbi:MAG: FAD-dependent oxidoreductase [Firmicutes bacterium]|nr:FAD-dependent oxidoreductase [Bacillota bacterium]